MHAFVHSFGCGACRENDSCVECGDISNMGGCYEYRIVIVSVTFSLRYLYLHIVISNYLKELILIHKWLFLVQCQTDGDCREGSFCNYKMGATYCEQCRDCKRRYFRQPARSRCAKSAEECGDCQQGYVDEVVSGVSGWDLCCNGKLYLRKIGSNI
jgi:hypothetical protein